MGRLEHQRGEAGRVERRKGRRGDAMEETGDETREAKEECGGAYAADSLTSH